MNIIKKEIKTNYKAIIIWSICASLMAYLSISVFDSVVKESAESFDEIIKNLPKPLLDGLNINDSAFNNILNFYALKGYLYVTLIISVMASMYGVKLINKEESEQTIEFILTRPISRFKYITEKLISLLIFIVFVNVITGIALYIGVNVGTKDIVDNNIILLYTMGTTLISITFGLISFMISAIARRKKGLSGVSIGIVLLSFILSILSNITSDLSFLKYLSFFEYANANDILDGFIDIKFIGAFIFIILVSIVTSYKVYMKKDIYL